MNHSSKAGVKSALGKRGPWTTLESTIVYANPWISVREDKVLRPDGSPGIYGIVDCRPATGVVALTDDNEVYLVGQFRYPSAEYSWEIIEGGADEGETPLEGIKRELLEEAGLVARHWEALAEGIQLSNCHSSELAYLYLARDLEIREQSPDPTELLTVKKLPFDEVHRMALNGELKDGMTVLGILLAAQHLLLPPSPLRSEHK